MRWEWEREELEAIFEAVCGQAADGGRWSEETAGVVGRLAQALGITPDLPQAVGEVVPSVVLSVPDRLGPGEVAAFLCQVVDLAARCGG